MTAEHHGMDEQEELVEQLVAQQRGPDRRAADANLAFGLTTQSGELTDRVIIVVARSGNPACEARARRLR